jgi:hypothetical protein
MDDQANPSLRGIVGAVALILGLVGLFTLNGVVGRVQRNEPEWFTASLVLITLAATCYLLGELLLPPQRTGDDGSSDTETNELEAPTPRPSRTDRARAHIRTALRWLAPIMGLCGVLAAVISSVGSTTARERPVVTGSLAATADRAFTATVKVASLSSHDRVAVIVDGLTPADSSFKPHTVYQAYIGPDQEGRIDHSVTLTIPHLDTYEAVGVKAYTGPVSHTSSSSEDTPCEKYPRQVSSQQDVVRQQGPGCVIIEVPTPTSIK